MLGCCPFSEGVAVLPDLLGRLVVSLGFVEVSGPQIVKHVALQSLVDPTLVCLRRPTLGSTSVDLAAICGELAPSIILAGVIVAPWTSKLARSRLPFARSSLRFLAFRVLQILFLRVSLLRPVGHRLRHTQLFTAPCLVLVRLLRQFIPLLRHPLAIRLLLHKLHVLWSVFWDPLGLLAYRTHRIRQAMGLPRPPRTGRLFLAASSACIPLSPGPNPLLLLLLHSLPSLSLQLARFRLLLVLGLHIILLLRHQLVFLPLLLLAHSRPNLLALLLDQWRRR